MTIDPLAVEAGVLRLYNMNQQKERFIKEYLAQHGSASAVDARFHEEWFKRFGGRRKEACFGAQPVTVAMRWLKRLHDEGTLDRGRVSLVGMGSGFPNWVYSYTLTNKRPSS